MTQLEVFNLVPAIHGTNLVNMPDLAPYCKLCPTLDSVPNFDKLLTKNISLKPN